MNVIKILLAVYCVIPISAYAQSSGHCFANDNKAFRKKISRALLLKYGRENLPVPPDYFYAGSKQGFVLTNSVNGQVAVLVIDQNKIPAIYPLLYPKKCCTALQFHTNTDILSHWTPAARKKNELKFLFYGWNKTKWEPFEIDLKFKNHHCVAFRVNCEVPIEKGWIKTEDMPNHENRPDEDGKLILPIELGICEGPKDMIICGIGLDKSPVTKKESEALKQKKCAMTYTPKN